MTGTCTTFYTTTPLLNLILPIYFYFLAKIEINFQFCAKFSDKLGCYWKYIGAARFFKFLKFVLKLQSSDWFGPFTQKINDKKFQTKISFWNDKDFCFYKLLCFPRDDVMVCVFKTMTNDKNCLKPFRETLLSQNDINVKLKWMSFPF